VPAPGVTLRSGGMPDAEVITDTMLAGFATFGSFAQPGWTPPARDRELARARERLPRAWVLLAEDAGEPAGHVAMIPDEQEPGGAYLWQLFVRRPWWGTGLAAELHGRFVAAARERGHERARALTPAGQARARRFYAREGWRVDGEPFAEPGLGLDLVVIRRSL
jgi:GNAT superfamily N-acetyltransferase